MTDTTHVSVRSDNAGWLSFKFGVCFGAGLFFGIVSMVSLTGAFVRVLRLVVPL
jgi:hypothetical protein